MPQPLTAIQPRKLFASRFYHRTVYIRLFLGFGVIGLAVVFALLFTMNNQKTKDDLGKFEAQATTKRASAIDIPQTHQATPSYTEPPPSTTEDTNSTQLSVNGQKIPVPVDGSSSTTINGSSTTIVSVSNQSSLTQSSSGSSSSNNVSVNVTNN